MLNNKKFIFFMSIPSLIALFFIIVILGAQIIKRPFLEKNLKKLFWIPLVAIFSTSVVFSVMQYQVWRQHELMRIALEGEDGFSYFLSFIFFNHFASYLLALGFAGILILLMFFANKRVGERLFEREEIWIAFLAGLLVGFPGFLFFLVGILMAYLSTHFINAILRKTVKSGVIPLYYFWLPVSASVIIISEIWLVETLFWQLLSV